MKKLLGILGCFLASCIIVFGYPYLVKSGGNLTNAEVTTNETSLLEQNVLRVESQPHEINKIYDSGQLIAVLTDRSKLNTFLKSVYKDTYQEDFPNSDVALGKDVYVSSEQSYFTYSDVDSEIFAYLKDNERFTVRAIGVDFADSNGIYAEIFVLSEDMYQSAMQEYLELFIDSNELMKLNSGGTISSLKTYGSQAVGVSVSQTISTREAYADPREIRKTEAEIMEYLEYGDNTEKQYYTVEKYDTVAGVGSKNYGLSATQIMNINKDKIFSTDQVLSEGDQLCVTYFNSPIDIVVTRENMRKETVNYDTEYVEDPNLREGVSELASAGVVGSRNALYSEKWINGVLVSGSLQSSVDTLQPVNAVISVGTMVLPDIGTGTFRWPVDNPVITCRWGCYYGHRAIDIQNSYDHYGNIYAADNGTVEVNSYNGVNGNYVIIDHNNGYETYYGHMNVPSPLKVGDIVEQGDVIGQLGMTGAATGPHTHFFIMFNGERKNPCDGYLACDGFDG